MKSMWYISITDKAKGLIGTDYLLTETLLCNLILPELNMLLCKSCGCYFISFIEYIVVGKTFSEYTSLVLLNCYQKNDKIIYVL